MLRAPMKFLFLGCCLAACTGSDRLGNEISCDNKLSLQLKGAILRADADRGKIGVIATLMDTLHLTEEFPTIHILDQHFARGHFTKEEIMLLCKNTSVLHLDIIRERYPSQ